MTNHVKQLEERLEIYRSKDTDKLTIQTFKELGTDKAYHICTFKQKELVPNVSQRGLPGESNTVLRVCVGLDILACIKGYSTTDNLLTDEIAGYSRNGKTYKGGLYILRNKFEVLVKPAKMHVPDVIDTKERWLISYSPETTTFKVDCVGKLIPISVTVIPEVKRLAKTIITFAVAVTDKEGLQLDKDTYLKEGYYQFDYIKDPNKDSKDEIVKLEELSEDSYDKIHNLKAAMLSHQDKPSFTKW